MNNQFPKTRTLLIVLVVLAFSAVLLLVFDGKPLHGLPPKDEFSGVVTLDQNGEATIALPASDIAQETDFTYQATSLGAPMPNLYLKSELQNGSFTVAGGTPGGQVEWQLFAVRKAS